MPGTFNRNTSKNETREFNFNSVPQELKSKTAEFFGFLLDSNITKGYDVLMNGSYIEGKRDKVEQLINSTRRAFDIYGRIQGFEPVDAEQVSSSFIRVRYLGKHSRFPLRWIFTFYKSPDKGWIITNVKFDDDTETFFDRN